ncbi:YciI family protein [Exercitatus varius]|uniref:YciI family protein n=1 Tax=Exercitatus varius TaxID=67857 RepID=UPI00294B763F|nr:YciI family protein [Exercitatus varius]MDG2958531.1 YciI family protein [Exercitatus varius]
MFIASLNYIRPLDKIEQYLEAHRAFLDKYYQRGVFLMSGRKEPRTGGIILIHAANLDEVNRIIGEDPFNREKVAEYTITEFLPSKTAAGLEKYLQI